MRQDAAARLRALKVDPKIPPHRTAKPEEAMEIIRAYRRGIPMEQIAKAVGRGRGNLYAIVGTWALRHAHLPEDNER